MAALRQTPNHVECLTGVPIALLKISPSGPGPDSARWAASVSIVAGTTVRESPVGDGAYRRRGRCPITPASSGSERLVTGLGAAPFEQPDAIRRDCR